MASTPPTALSVTPPASSGTSETFTYVASSPNGYGYISSVQILLNWAVDGNEACYLEYHQSSNLVYLLNDQGTSWGNGATLGSSGTLSNSQCQINTGTMTVSGGADRLTLNVTVTFLPAFLGPLGNYVNATDQAGNSSGWQELGTWTAYAASSQPPSVDSVTPSSGTGTAQTFTYSISDVNGYEYLGNIIFTINSSDSAVNACVFSFYPSGNQIFLLNNADTAWLPPATLGSSGTLSNSQCQLNLSGSSMSGSGNNLTITLALTFTSTFSGTQNQYVLAGDHAGNYPSIGPYATWNADVGTVATPTFSPAAGSYTSAQTITLSTTTSGATIRYTTNGNTPTTSSAVYTGPITVNASETINAIAYESDWANSAVGSATYTISGATATYTVQTSPVSLSIVVDSVQYSAPQTFQWVVGSVHTIAVNSAIQAGGTGVQYSYDSWSDLGGQSHAIVAPAAGGVYSANFTSQYYLTMTPAFNPVTHASEGTVYPASGWYNANSAIQVSAVPANGYIFTGFTGGVTGGSPQVLTITQATTVTSGFQIAPLVVTSPAALPSATVGVAYSQQLTATGGIPPYSWHVQPGTQLPQPFQLNTAGVLYGTPTSAGSFGGLTYVTDTQGWQTSYWPTFTINPSDTAPAVTCTSSATSVSLGQSVTFSASVTGGAPGYTYAWTATSNGGSLGTTSSITFKTSTLGLFSASVTVHDSANGTSFAGCSVTVQPATTAGATMFSPSPGSQLTGTSTNFQWGDGSGVSQYALMIGSTLGGSDLYNANTGLTNFATVTGLPTDGRTLYVTLSSFISGSWTSNSYTYHASSTSSTLAIIPAPYSETIAGPTPASFTITVNSNAGLSGTVGFTAAGIPAGATFSFNPSTISGSGTTDLTITPASNSGTGMFPVAVTASNGSQSVTTVVTLNVVTPSPATLLTPANGGMLTGGTATTFTWDAGYGATQYQLSIGTTPGGSDIGSVNTGATRSQILDEPCADASRVYVTLSSMINGAWMSRSYEESWCDCGGDGGGGGGGGGGGDGGGGNIQVPTIQLVSSEPNVLNNGQQQIGTYQIYDLITNLPLDALAIDKGSALVCGQVCGQVSAQVSNTNGSLFDVTFAAAPAAVPGQQTLSVTWNGLQAPPGPPPTQGGGLQNAVQVDDGTPMIAGIWPPAIPPNESSVLISLYGTNFGPAPGSIAICATPADPCTSNAVQVATTGSGSQNIPYWSDKQVNVFVNTSASASGTYYVQLTSGGESPGLGFVAAPNGQSSAQSNFAPLQVAQASSGPTTIISGGITIASSTPGWPCPPGSCSVVVGQQVSLTGSPAGGSWNIAGTILQEWNPNGSRATPAIQSATNVAFYWVNGGNLTVSNSTFNATVSYTVNATTASVTFVVGEPILIDFTPSPTNPHIENSSEPSPGWLGSTLNISATVNPPPSGSGTLTWVQVLPSDGLVYTDSSGTNWTCAFPGIVFPTLDGGYPYSEDFGDTSTFFDEPATQLEQGQSKVTNSGTFMTYLLWQPNLATGITTFPVPLYVEGWSVNAVATLANGVWTATGTLNQTSVQTTSTYPTWSSTLPQGTKATCTPQ
jgi:hypothetical protein